MVARDEKFMIDNESTDLSEEINPYLVYRICDDQLECAVWTLDQGHQALALFLSPESGDAYVNATDLGETWKIYRPAKIDLMAIIKQTIASGIFLAVLDPDQKEAKRLFDLREMVIATDNASDIARHQ